MQAQTHKVVVVVSDLHMGGGAADPGDDFVYNSNQFPRLLEELTRTPEGRSGQIELFINGDFLELVQTLPEVYREGSAKYWCSEPESVRKLEAVMDGHPEIFASLASFQTSGNAVTIAPGNHDIDLYWIRVQQRIREAIPQARFEIGQVWMTRFDGRLQISHGNQIDPANRFAHWDNPVVLGKYGQLRLEMCPGTLFMVKFVNWLEKQYPFADNLHPVTKIAGILAKEDRFGFVAASWILARFASRYPAEFLSTENKPELHSGKQLLDALKYDSKFRARLTETFQRVRNTPEITQEAVVDSLASEDSLAEFMQECLAALDVEEWLRLFDMAKPEVLATGGNSGDTLAIMQSGALAENTWREAAKRQWDAGAQVVVIGHTHLPESVQSDGKSYYNPGSWTRYVGGADLASLRLEDLRREDKFPYQLNYVRVEEDNKGKLSAAMFCFEERKSFSS